MVSGCTSSPRHVLPAVTTSSTVAEATSTIAGLPPITAPPIHATEIHVRLTALDASPSCRQAVATGRLDAVLSAFRAARVRGRAAEGCLTRPALSSYCTAASPCPERFFLSYSPGPICLYSCRGYRITDMTFYAQRGDDGTVTARVEVHREPSTTPTSARENAGNENEFLTFGHGTPVGASRAATLVVTQADTSL